MLAKYIKMKEKILDLCVMESSGRTSSSRMNIQSLDKFVEVIKLMVSIKLEGAFVLLPDIHRKK